MYNFINPSHSGSAPGHRGVGEGEDGQVVG